MPSIRGKITLGYLALAAGLGGFVLFASADLRFLESRVREGVTISSFQQDVQEMRRHEKNHFLYGSVPELAEARALASRLSAQAWRDERIQAAAGSGDELGALRRDLDRYRALLEQPADGPGLPEADIRAAGHAVSGRSEGLAGREREGLVALLQQSRLALYAAVGVVVLLAVAGGRLLYRAVGRPLRRLEEQLRPLAQGRYEALSEVSRDREMVSFTAALNRMLGDLELRRHQLVQAEKLAALGTLASGVAHELNNPLGNISGACQILLEELDDLSLPTDAAAQLRQWLAQIDDETERARRIVRTLLDYSRKPHRAGGSCQLARTLDKALLLLRPRLPGPDTVRADVPAGLAARVDGQRLQQVFINLIQNALDAGPDSVRVAVLARTARPADWPPPDAAVVVGSPPRGRPGVLLTVEDDGPGIPQERIGHIFEPFYTTRAPGEGTGLGLYIVGEIVQEQGGAVAVSSRPGGGARFSILLPRGAGHD